VNPLGCRHCFNGRQGRSIVAEVVATDAHLMALLSENKLEDASRYWLSPYGLNGITMQWHGLEKIRDGVVAPYDSELEVGPCASDREIRMVEERLGRKDKWIV
jgi:type II secretory ATPase GspE/PulE/Tfp pilus assembly ATPase PilB-like protein